MTVSYGCAKAAKERASSTAKFFKLELYLTKFIVAFALVSAVLKFVSTLQLSKNSRTGVEKSLDAARTSACGTTLADIDEQVLAC